MSKLYLIGVVVVVSLGIGVALYFGGQSLNRELVGFTEFSQAGDVTRVIQEKLAPVIESKKLIFIGPHPQKSQHMNVALDLLSVFLKDKSSLLVVDRILSERVSEVAALNATVRLDLVRDREQFLKIVKELKSGQKLVYLGPNIYVTHSLYQGPMDSLKSEMKPQDYLVLSFTSFPLSKDQERDFDFPCRTGESSASQLELGCLVLSQARKYYGKQHSSGTTPGFLNQVNEQEFMFFLGQ